MSSSCVLENPPCLPFFSRARLSITVSSSPAQWNPNIQEYSELDILLMAIMYNDDFYIENSEHIETKRQKFCMWLMGEEFEEFEQV